MMEGARKYHTDSFFSFIYKKWQHSNSKHIFPSIYKMAARKLKAYFSFYLLNGSMQTQSICDLLVYRNQLQVKQAGDRPSQFSKYLVLDQINMD